MPTAHLQVLVYGRKFGSNSDPVISHYTLAIVKSSHKQDRADIFTQHLETDRHDPHLAEVVLVENPDKDISEHRLDGEYQVLIQLMIGEVKSISKLRSAMFDFANGTKYDAKDWVVMMLDRLRTATAVDDLMKVPGNLPDATKFKSWLEYAFSKLNEPRAPGVLFVDCTDGRQMW